MHLHHLSLDSYCIEDAREGDGYCIEDAREGIDSLVEIVGGNILAVAAVLLHRIVRVHLA